MLFATLLGDTAVTAGAQVPSVVSFNNSDVPAAGTVYSGVKFDADGLVYRRQLNGAWGLVGTWMLTGVNTAYHIHRTVDAGALDTDAGDDLVLSSDRIYDVQETSPGNTDTASVTFRISNVGDSTTYDTGQYSFSAEMELP